MRAEHLYVHVPFCARRCVYCDFSIAVRPRVPEEEYLGALERELATRHAGSVLHLGTLYFGGGTPSRLSPDGVHRMVDVVRRHASISGDAEVTLEANPDDVTRDAARAWHAAGITRVSLGVQSFHPGVLAWMHRTHGPEESHAAVEILRDAGLAVSVDLIFAVPQELGRSWPADLEQGLALAVPHLSIYGLTVEPHTPLGRWVARHEVDEAPEESFEHEFLLADRELTAAGYRHYEVSNYARPGSESRHNSAYWARRPYAGVGPSAHEFDGARRRWNVAAYAEWVDRASRGETVIADEEALRPEQVGAEEVYLGLRTGEGVVMRNGERPVVDRWVHAAWARVDGDRLRLTPEGWLRLDTIAAALTHLRSRY